MRGVARRPPPNRPDKPARPHPPPNRVGAKTVLWHEQTMNTIRLPHPPAPRHALLARQDPIRPEPPLWASSLSSKPVWSGKPADLRRPREDTAVPLFPVLETILGTWDPGRHPLYRMAPQQPMRREAAAIAPPENPIHRDAAAPDPLRNGPLRSGPLRNGNPRGNPNSAPRCGARTRLGCPCQGPAMKNGRCRMHGGAATGPRTAEGRARIAAAARSRATNPIRRELEARTTALAARSRVLAAVVETGLPLEAVTPLLLRLRPEACNSPCAVSPALLFDTALTPGEARGLVRWIRAAAQPAPKTPYTVSRADNPVPGHLTSAAGRCIPKGPSHEPQAGHAVLSRPAGRRHPP